MGHEQQIESRMKKIFLEQLTIDEATFALDAKIRDDLGVDSLDAVELALTLEDEFGIELSDEDVQKVVTVRDAIHLVEDKVEARAGTGG